jgi:trk system potassium uptake protein TrkA
LKELYEEANMKIIIVGCGRMGSKLAHDLSLGGHHVTVIDRNRTAFDRLGPGFKGEKIIGVGFDRDVLIQAGIEQADGFAAVTASDETNVTVARLASQMFRVPRVVARVFEPHKAKIYRRLGLQTISPIELGSDRLVDLLSSSSLETVTSLGNGEVHVVNADVPAMLVGRSVEDLVEPGEFQVMAITRNGKTFLAARATVLAYGDLIHLAVNSASMDRLKASLGLH